VFADEVQRRRLDELMHPPMRRRIAAAVAAARDAPDVPAVVLDAAVLIEAGWDELCTHLVFVEAPAERRFQRAAAARRWDRPHWLAREKSQIPLDNKRARCQYIVDSSSDVSCLREQVRDVFRKIVQPADPPR
jgi:dephospho-CoA kinase